MNEWLIRIAIALIAGGFGAIVRPWINDWLHNRRRTRSEDRQRVDEWISMINTRSLIAARAVVAIEKGHPPQHAAAESDDLLKEWVRKQPVVKFPWAPDRIQDGKLRGLLTSAMTEVNAMTNETSDVARGGEPGDFCEKLKGGMNRIETTRKSIDIRLRELKL